MSVCVYAPSKGTDLFYTLKKQLGYQMAWKVMGLIMNPKFQSDFKNSLSLDAEGVPTLSSVMNNSEVKKFIGDEGTRSLLQKDFKPVKDTISNYKSILEDAHKFNTSNENNSRFWAIVERNEDGNLQVKIVNRTEESESIFKNQYMSASLNDRLVKILDVLGITVGQLSEVEMSAGRVGVTDFNIARSLGESTATMIRVANNMEGAGAISEEFSHLIIGALRTRPLVQRALQALIRDDRAVKEILGDEYEDTVRFQNGDRELIAEEALGKLLRNNLHKEYSGSSRTILNRFINFIKSLFKNISLRDVNNALAEADGAMSQLAQDILKGKADITTADVASSKRDVQFNALSDRINRNIDILKNARKTELKRAKISSDSAIADSARDRLSRLDQYTNENADTALGIFLYAQNALNDLTDAMNGLRAISSTNPQDSFNSLRGIRAVIQSYGEFIDDLTNAMNEEESEGDNLFARRTVTDISTGVSVDVDIEGVLNSLNQIIKRVSNQYMKVAKDTFAEFLKPILGEEVVMEIGNKAGNVVKVRDLLDKADGDISFMDLWLDSMGDSADVLLQAFDEIVKRVNDRARITTINFIRKVQKLRMKAESLGITDTSWMFEHYSDGTKTGNYLSEVNESQFRRDFKEFKDHLNEKYGTNPTGQAARDKLNERDEWLKAHAYIDIFGNISADSTLYHNSEYDKIKGTPKEEIYNEFLALKKEVDDILPENRVAPTKAIQIRKNGVQRFINAATSPSKIFENIKEHLKEEFLEQEDDDSLFGDRTARGLTDFAGNEFMVLPVLYTNRLKNPDELSDDVFGALMAYSSMGFRYEELDKVIDPLEVGRSIILDKGRKVRKTRGGKELVERLTGSSNPETNEIYVETGSNIEKKLQDFFESQVYGRYYKDQGVIGPVNVNKLVSWAMKKSSFFQLGFNFLANLGNVTTGIAMQNIEAISGEYFNAKELAAADATYLTELKDFILESGARNKKSKLALIDEYFNIKGEFNENLKFADQRRSWLKRLFGSSVAFLGQECGDHWLYNRTLIAMMKREKVNVPGKGTMSLWDAIEVVNTFEDNNDIKSLHIPEGTTTENGEEFNLGKFSRKVLAVNQSLFGKYNDADLNAANRVAVGRLVMQYRKWMKAQYNKRFQGAQKNLALGQDEEGYYRTTAKLLWELRNGTKQVAIRWGQMNTHERANIKRAVAEIIQFAIIGILANIISWPKDKKRPWALKLAEYSSKRLYHETANLTPGPWAVNEWLQTVQSPAATLSLIRDCNNLVMSAMDPRDWTDELQSGPYKGYSTLEKNTLKAPLPGVGPYRQIDKFVNDIDRSIQFYGRTR